MEFKIEQITFEDLKKSLNKKQVEIDKCLNKMKKEIIKI